MPLLIIHDGSRSCPTVVCDHCGQAIDDAAGGNYQWRHGDGTVDFTHKRCRRDFERSRPGEGRWLANELPCLPIYPANNLKLNEEAARALVARIDRIG
jgi:hypothetical protein